MFYDLEQIQKFQNSPLERKSYGWPFWDSLPDPEMQILAARSNLRALFLGLSSCLPGKDTEKPKNLST